MSYMYLCLFMFLAACKCHEMIQSSSLTLVTWEFRWSRGMSNREGRTEGGGSLKKRCLLFSCSVMSSCLQPHGLQQARFPCPSPSPGVCSNSSPLSWWCHLILYHPLLFLPSIFPSIRFFSDGLALHIRWPKYWSFSFSISPSNQYSGLIFFRFDWFDIFAV